MRSLFSLVTSPVSLLLIFGWPLMERKRGILRGVSMTFPKSTTVTRKTRKPRGPWCLSLLSFEKANNQDILRGNFQNDFQNFFRKSFGKSYSNFQKYMIQKAMSKELQLDLYLVNYKNCRLHQFRKFLSADKLTLYCQRKFMPK